ncbi:MAG: hypothetical protein H6577_15055 [Lewinellaceae bacterium]|nr:hypothetical protein [Saprospiraceae bacterium]MCB9339446.1 hypothetical protein [Lewinellaceae bacterium]
MKQFFRLSFFLCMACLVFPFIVAAQAKAEWELKRDKGGIKVYVKDSPTSKIKELKFTTEIEASLNTVAAVLTYVEGYDDWVYSNKESRTIKRISDTEMYYYTELKFPWPFDNRDLVLHSIIWQDPKTLAIHSQTNSVHWMESEKDGVVRIKVADLHWAFTPLGGGKIRVEYHMVSDPGGNIPAWMVNLAADQGPLQTMVKFKEMLEKEKYKNARLAFVQEMK